MRFRGRNIDVIELWSQYVEFAGNVSEKDIYLPKVVCPNPQHDTTKRHFQINSQDGLVHCFAYCGISGSFAHALCVVHGLYDKYKVEEATTKGEKYRRQRRARREAEREILKYSTGVGKASHRKKNYTHSSRAVDVDSLVYEKFLPPVALEYLAERGIASRSIAEWELGWLSDEKRIVIPAQDLNGITRFLIKRSVREQDYLKYLYTEGYPKTSLLFGACKADQGLLESLGLILTEGSIKAIRLHQHGLRTATAILGTGISDEQVKIILKLRPSRVYLMFDKDMAGIKNIEIAARKLRSFPLFVCRYPKHIIDPDQFTKEEAYRSVERAIPFAMFLKNVPNARPTERAING